MTGINKLDPSFLGLLKFQKREPRVLRIYQRNREYISDRLDYALNSHSYRSPEFSEDTEILFIGCSQTFGSGLPIDARWPNMVAGATNTEKYAVISGPGFSAQKMVADVNSFIREFGKPKLILGNFPDLFRHNFITDYPHTQVAIASENNSPIKSPIPNHYSVYLSLSSILALEVLCKNSGIKIIWTFWDIGADAFFDGVDRNNHEFSDAAQNVFEFYHPDKDVGIFKAIESTMRFSPSGKVLQDGKEAPTNCCQHMYELFPDCYHFAHDRYDVPEKFQILDAQLSLSKEMLDELRRKTIRLGWAPAHPGAHRQWHWAKFFLERM